MLPPDVPFYFLPAQKATDIRYTPLVAGAARLHYLDDKRKVDQTQSVIFGAPVHDRSYPSRLE